MSNIGSKDSVNAETLLSMYGEYKRAYSDPKIRYYAELVEKGGHDHEGRIFHGILFRFVRIDRFIVVLLAALILTAGFIQVRSLFEQAIRLRNQLDSVREAIGVDRAVEVSFGLAQPNIVQLEATIDTALVQTVTVTYDKGESWKKLYSRSPGDYGGLTEPSQVVRIMDHRAFAAPPSGTRTITVCVHVEYIPDIIKAWPQYQKPENTDHIAYFQLTPSLINKTVEDDAKSLRPEVSMGTVPMALERWEVINSTAATSSITNDPADGTIVQRINLEKVGEYVNLSHALPGAKPSSPAVSLENLTGIEIEFLWEGDGPVAIELKLVDERGKTVGVTRFVEPSSKSQTILIPARSLKGYWGIRTFDYSRVCRLELAVARKAVSHAAEGTMKVQRVELFGIAQMVASTPTPRAEMITLAELSLIPAGWSTAHSKDAAIRLSAKDSLLVCGVDMPYDEKVYEEFPWTNLRIELGTHDFSRLEALELELRWEAEAPITLEPMLVCTERADTYGRHIRIHPSQGFERILVYPQDLKLYWSVAGITDATRLNLSELNAFSLGIAKKERYQAEHGTLYIKSVRLLGQ